MKIGIEALKNAFGVHDEWHAYKNVRTGKVFCRHKALQKPGPEIEKIGTANGCCHKDALRAAKKTIPLTARFRGNGPTEPVGVAVMPDGSTSVSGPKKLAKMMRVPENIFSASVLTSQQSNR